MFLVQCHGKRQVVLYIRMLLELRRQGPVTVATRNSMNRYGFESSYAFAGSVLAQAPRFGGTGTYVASQRAASTAASVHSPGPPLPCKSTRFEGQLLRSLDHLETSACLV